MFYRILAIALFAIAMSSLPPRSDAATASRDLAKLCDEYWQGYLRAYPTTATSLGDKRYDDRLDDVTPAGIASETRRLGRSGVEVTIMGFGGAPLGWKPADHGAPPCTSRTKTWHAPLWSSRSYASVTSAVRESSSARDLPNAVFVGAPGGCSRACSNHVSA